MRKLWKRRTAGDAAFSVVTYVFILLVLLVTLYPFLYIISSSVSDAGAVARAEVWLLPKGPLNVDAYQRVLSDPMLLTSYGNTLWYVAVGTIVNLVMTTTLAYPLARTGFKGKRVLMMGIVFTMYFSGGMVPSYILVKNLGLIDNRWALIIPVAISTYNLIVTRSFFEGIPDTIHEAATIDGAGEFRIFSQIILPLSKPILATMVLFYAVSHWNSYFNAMLYLNKEEFYPLQLFLRRILIQYEASEMMTDVMNNRDSVSMTIRYAAIVISTLPIMCVYPFLQKYFVKGVMVGAIKG